MKRRGSAWWVVALAVLAPLFGRAQDDLYVTITSPPPGQPVFGEVEFAVEVTPTDQVEAVELFVDGDLAGRLEEPPFRVRFDVGQENREHRFEAVVRGLSGAMREARRVTPSVRVDEEVDLELQQLYVTVTRGEERVLDLGRDEVAVVDDGEPQKLVTFERGDIPLVALLLLDASVSMRGRPLEMATNGAQAFIRGMNPLDRAKLLLFSDRVIHTSPFTGFAEVLGAGLQAVTAAGGTALNDHLYMALKLLEERQGRRVVVLLTDGVDVASVLNMRDVERVARRSQALLYWIRLGRPNPYEQRTSAWRDARQHHLERRRLEELIVRSGGRILSLSSLAETAGAFENILRELREQYVLGYYPTRNRNDGSWHRVRVRLTRPGLTVRTREGYLDD